MWMRLKQRVPVATISIGICSTKRIEINREYRNSIIPATAHSFVSDFRYTLVACAQAPGKFMLSYMPRVKAIHEFITVTPDGFRFRQQVFPSLNALFKWFKEHFRKQTGWLVDILLLRLLHI
jgi:hypothetical protein